jgi:hypothetical protein
MAKKNKDSGSVRGGYQRKPKKKRPGIHSKKRVSKLKASKHYKKLNRGQGKTK